MIPKRFIRIWFGEKKIPEKFEEWWVDFQLLHPDYEFLTITDFSLINPPQKLIPLINEVGTYAGLADIARIIALYELGGVYVDTDVMPLKKFDDLLLEDTPFLARRSGKSFEIAVIGSPPKHPAFEDLINALPSWFYNNKDKAASVQTGPAFFSKVLFGRKDIRHLPPKTFYPYNGFMAPSRIQKIKIFANKDNFPNEMYAAHFSNHRWGGKPK